MWYNYVNCNILSLFHFLPCSGSEFVLLLFNHLFIWWSGDLCSCCPSFSHASDLVGMHLVTILWMWSFLKKKVKDYVIISYWWFWLCTDVLVSISIPVFKSISDYTKLKRVRIYLKTIVRTNHESSLQR